jgi:23S rRNA (uridine2552-2'-O)-methyltransferase
MDEHVNDPYVRRAKAEGYRSRAAFKLLELDRRDRLFASGQVVVDLGAAPGSWSQIALSRIGPRGRVIAIDLLPVAPIAGVSIIQGDFTGVEGLNAVTAALGGARADVVLSDMAPNIAGVPSADQARSIGLAECALEFALSHLKPGGVFVVKVFQGVGFVAFLERMRDAFGVVVSRKPDASRDRSPETFLVGRRPRLSAPA